MRWKPFSRKLTPNTIHQILSESIEFYRRTTKNILTYFYWDTVYTSAAVEQWTPQG